MNKNLIEKIIRFINSFPMIIVVIAISIFVLFFNVASERYFYTFTKAKQEKLILTIEALTIENDRLRTKLEQREKVASDYLVEDPRVQNCIKEVYFQAKINRAKRIQEIMKREGMSLEDFKEYEKIPY